MNGPEFQVVQREMAPRLAAFNDQINQNAPLFKRIEAVYNSPEKARLTPEQQRLAWLYYTNFVRAGARLSPEAKARLSQINQQLAGLYTNFSQNVLAEETDQCLVLKTECGTGRALAVSARCGRRSGNNKEAAGLLGDHEHPFFDRSVPHLL